MTVLGLEAITYGVSDLETARRFLTDWGLKKIGNGARAAEFATLDGGRVTARPREANDLPPAIEDGSTVRQIVWGVDSKKSLEAIGAKLSRHSNIKQDRDGTIHAIDPAGMAIAFAVSKRRKMHVTPTGTNAPGNYRRVDKAIHVYDHATPIKLGHVVLSVPDLEQQAEFYVKNFGFAISDRYMEPDMKTGRGIFLRCSTPGDHHNMFLIKNPAGKTALNHVAYTVSEIHEVFGGGLNLSRKGWPTEIGPGHHPISSAYFWYFKNPCGGAAEYFADEDHVTRKWRSRKFSAAVPTNFAEWAQLDGVRAPVRDIKAHDTHQA